MQPLALRPHVALIAAPLVLCAASPAQQAVSWEAAGGVLPEAATPAWTLVDSSLTPPSLGPASLTLQTSSLSANQYYAQLGAAIAAPGTLVIEAGVWFVSGVSTGSVRAPISIVFGMENAMENTLSIGLDELFLYAAPDCNTKGNSVSLPTSDGFHDYRIEVELSSGDIDVYYDGQHSGLTGSLVLMSGSCTNGQLRILWGEISILAQGVSEWAYFKHNAGASGSSVPYCTAGTSASGCQATLSTSGTPSATASSGFTLSAASVEAEKDGLFFFGTNGRQANSWGNGTSFQCVVPPVKRGGILQGSGTSGTCQGSFAQDLNALWQAAPNKNPGAGALVQAQLWYRDPQNTSNQTTSLSSAVEFTVAP